MKIRFFVPEADVSLIKVGQAVQIAMDGVKDRVPANISFISQQAEFTPPMIFSVESRKKLVFMVEARTTPENAFKLYPGQPLSVFININRSS